jgi:hypothetical protein
MGSRILNCTMGTRTLWVTWWDREHWELQDGIENIVSYTTGSRTLCVKRWKQGHCGLHDVNKNTVVNTTGTRTLSYTTGSRTLSYTMGTRTLSYTTGSRTLWVTRREQEKFPCTTGIWNVVGSVNQQNVSGQPGSRPRRIQDLQITRRNSRVPTTQ